LAGVLALVALASGLTPTAGATDELIGTLELLGPDSDCPAGFQCTLIRVTCANPDVAPMTGRIAIAGYGGTRRGTLLAFGGGGGEDLWLAGLGGRPIRKRLSRAGLEVISVSWDEAWNEGTAGIAPLTCRAATVIEWASARDAAAGSSPPPGAGVCGMCVIGYSVGSAQVAEAVSFYDVGDALDAVIAASGPPTADITAGCRRDGSPMQYLEPNENVMRLRIDAASGWEPNLGPCAVLPEDLSASPTWDASSLVLSGRLGFPTTRFSFVFGNTDRTGAVGQGIAYLSALYDAGTTQLGYACVPAHHDILEIREGRDAIMAALLWTPDTGAPLNVPPVPVAGLESRCGLASANAG
jgi:hypothetical protein